MDGQKHNFSHHVCKGNVSSQSRNVSRHKLCPDIKTFCSAKTLKLKNLKLLRSVITFTAENLSNQFKVALEVGTKIAKVPFDLFWPRDLCLVACSVGG